jgi:hypothetical protein
VILAALALLLGQQEQVVLPAGTSVRLATVGPIDSRSVKQGQRFALRVAEDVAVGSRIIIPRSTGAVGEVEALSAKGMFGKAAKLTLSPLFVDVGGQRVNLIGSSTEKGHDAMAGAAVTTVLVGALGLIITGKSATVPSGSILLGRVRTDVQFVQK